MKKTKLQELSKNIGVSSNILDLIILKVSALSKTEIFLSDEIGDNFIDEIIKKLKDYKKGIPIEYILEKAEFYSLDFFVDKRTLIPRNDTEIMVDEAVETIVGIKKNITYIDIGTGTSCIGISTFLNCFKIDNCFVVDISSKALEVSKKNIKKHNLEDKIIQIKSSLLDSFLNKDSYFLEKNIVITANLPYIKDNDFENIDKETLENEPELALFGGKNTGFELYEKLILQAKSLKTLRKIEKIYLFIEIGFDQKLYSKNYLDKLGLEYKYFKDNSGIDRCIKINI